MEEEEENSMNLQNQYDERFAGQNVGDFYSSFDYDPNNIQYRQMTVEDWSQIPNNNTAYSQYWDSPNSFQPEQFSENTNSETTWYDVTFTVFFYINLLLSIVLVAGMITFAVKSGKNFIENIPQNNGESTEPVQTGEFISFTALRNCLLLCLGLSFAINILHFVYANVFSYYYIKFGMIIGVVLSFIFCLFPVATGFFYGFLFPLLTALLSLFWYCAAKSRIPFSSAIFKQTTNLILAHPSIIVFCFIQTVLDLVINIAYVFVSYCVIIFGYNPLWVVYSVFSYTWITTTLRYVNYMTGAGLGASWYFLYNTPHYPKHPVLKSFKRAATTSFGSAAFAGFILAAIQALRALINLRTERRNNNNNENRGSEILFQIVRCMALCILNILEMYTKWISRYALIYCSIYGVPFSEGCRRFAELQCHKFINVLVDGCVIRDGINYNFIIFTVGSGFVGWLAAAVFYSASSLYAVTIAMTVVFTMVILLLMNEPMLTISDTLLICFAECPNRLRETNPDLYQILAMAYTNQLNLKLR